MIRLFLRGEILELDEAEQALWALEWRPGYPAQPPLYSWLQYLTFQIFGVHLFSLAFLKYALLLGAVYYYHLICRLYCATLPLAWCATFAWVLIPTISFDLLKDNTHSVAALLMAVLSWYYFIAPSKLKPYLWYSGLGLVIGLGLLTKFNYLIFLVILLLSAISLKVQRQKIFHKHFLWTVLIAGLLVTPYVYWLILNPHTAFSSMYKISAANKTIWDGLISLLKVSVIFILPVLCVSYLFFIGSKPKLLAPGLLKRYFQLVLPCLILLVLAFHFKNFQTRWLIPIYFLVPLVFFSRIPASPQLKRTCKYFMLFCLMIQLLLISALIYRGNFALKHQDKTQIANQLTKIIVQEKADAMISDSFWLLGNLRIQKHFPRVYWFQENYQGQEAARGQGQRILLHWVEPFQPLWVQDLLKKHHWECKPHALAFFSYCLVKR